jgi:hypothetical protein
MNVAPAPLMRGLPLPHPGSPTKLIPNTNKPAVLNVRFMTFPSRLISFWPLTAYTALLFH